jgi:hypothetical protein
MQHLEQQINTLQESHTQLIESAKKLNDAQKKFLEDIKLAKSKTTRKTSSAGDQRVKLYQMARGLGSELAISVLLSSPHFMS